MKKKIPFPYFKEGQYLKLDIGKLVDVEGILGKPTVSLLNDLQALSLTTITALLSVSVHEANDVPAKRPPKYYAARLQEYLSAGNPLDEIPLALTKAIISTGIAGAGAYLAVFPEDADEKLEKDAEEEKKV